MTRTTRTWSTGVVMAFLLCALWTPTFAAAATGFVPATDFDASVGNDLTQNPNVAAAPDGTAFVAWTKPGTPARTLVAVRPPGGAWATQDLGPSTGTMNGVPVAVAADGTATILLIDESGKFVRAFTRPPGGVFGNPRPLSTGERTVSTVALAVNAGGEAVAAWYENTGSAWQPRASYRDAGGWLPSTALISASGNLFPISAAINDAGRSVIGFTTMESGQLKARVSIRPAGGPFPSEADRLNTESIHSYNTVVAINAAGVVVAGYLTTVVPSSTVPADPKAVWRVAPATSTTFGSPQQLSGGSTNAAQIAVAAGPGDQLHAAWMSTPSNRIEYALGAVGGAAVARQLVSPVGESTLMPRLSVDAAGNRLVLWTNLSSFLVQAAYRPAGTPDFGPAQTVIASAGAASFARVAAAPDGQGNSVVAWSKPDGRGNTIAQAAGYDVAPPTLSNLTVPGTISATVSGAFGVTANDVWSTPSVQWSFGDGAGASGASVTHVYGGPGTFTANATATDAIGNTATLGAPVQVGEVDADGDGFTAGRDCNDRSASVNPGARDTPGNGVDENCNGSDATFRELTVNAELTWTRRIGRSATRIATLRLDGVRDGDKVAVKCTGRGCRKSANRTRTLKKVKKGKVSLTGIVSGLSLQPKARLSVTIARDDFATRVITYEMRLGKSPRKTTRCQNPGEKKTRTC